VLAAAANLSRDPEDTVSFEVRDDVATADLDPSENLPVRAAGTDDRSDLSIPLRYVQSRHAALSARRKSGQVAAATRAQTPPAKEVAESPVAATEVKANPTPLVPTVREVETGTVLRERYVIEHVVGIGGNSMVFQAIDRHRDAGEAGARVALKVLRPQLRGNQYALMRMRREFRQMQALTHSGIARVFDLDCDDNLWFMTLELIDGQTVTQWMKGGGTDAEAMQIITGCCEAVSYAHSRGIVHGDLKPSNVLVTPGFAIKLVDFGSAAAETIGDAIAVSARSFAATPPYASPQILTGNLADPRDDVFSLACIAYAVLTRGEHPFERKSSLDAFREQMRPAYSPKISPRVFEVIVRALAWQRQNRPVSAKEFLNALIGNDLGREIRVNASTESAAAAPTTAQAAPSVVSIHPSMQGTLQTVSVTLDVPQSQRHALPTQWTAIQPWPGFTEWSSAPAVLATTETYQKPAFTAPHEDQPLQWVNSEAVFTSAPLVQVARPEPRTIEGVLVSRARSGYRNVPPPRPSIWHRHGLAAVAVIGVLAILLGHETEVGSSTTPAMSPTAPAPVATTAAVMPAIRETTDTTQPAEPNIVEHVVPPPPTRVSPGFVSFESASIQVGANQSMAVLTVKRLDSTRGRAKIGWTIEGASGRAVVDESAINSQTIQFLDGQQVRSLYIPLVTPNDPGAHQPTRSFIVKLAKLDGSPAIGPLTETKVVIASGY